MSRVATKVLLAALAVGGAISVIILSSSGNSIATPPAPPPSSSSAQPFALDDDDIFVDRENDSAVSQLVGAIPTWVHLPGSSASIRPVGINPDGSMEIPDDPQEVGWYTLTNVRPGDDGTAVIAGHVDSRTQGQGVFFELATLRVGDDIVIETADGLQYWTVTGTEVYHRTALPIAEIFSLSGDPRLALVTCGGEFDPVARSYRDNVVVYAHPRLTPTGTN